MATLSATQIFGYARAAGFTVPQATIATAIALAESAGNPASHCLNCFPGVTEDSRGLWQINVDAHPQMASTNLYDPAANAKAAYEISNAGRNFKPWTTYTSGAWRSHIKAATQAAADVGASGGSTNTGTFGIVQDAGSAAAAAIAKANPLSGLSKDLHDFAIRGGVVLIGSALVVVGLYRAVQPTVQKVANVATKAAAA